jgi:protein O-mannosyl-transferase
MVNKVPKASSTRSQRAPQTAGQPALRGGVREPGPRSLSNYSRNGRVTLTCVLLFSLIVWVFAPALQNDFINYDDPLYVTDNPHVQRGLSWEGLAWAFGTVHGEGTYWHPLSWVSHMADYELYGLKPWGHHLTNVLLHATNAVLVFLVFFRMTGAFWRGAFLASLFALHPLQVDSVAWVAERKNLLSAFFWLLATWAYVRYSRAESGAGASATAGSRTGWVNYSLGLFCFMLGLMCKPVLVTLPFVLLLLDYWPLRRLRLANAGLQEAIPSRLPGSGFQRAGLAQSASRASQSAWRLLREKIPFLFLAIASSVITIKAHHGLGILGPVSKFPLELRLENALLSYARYLLNAVWPSHLAVFHPYTTEWPMWQVVTSGLVLLGVSGAAVGLVRRHQWLLVGWLWFLGVLFPFSGLVQAGAQSMAERFMYLPLIGLLIIVVWGLSELTRRSRYQTPIASCIGGMVLLTCLVFTRQQIGYWKDSQTVFDHACAVTERNYLAHNNLAAALLGQGRFEEVVIHAQEALKIWPEYADAHNNLGLGLGNLGRLDQALGEFREALRIRPRFAEAHCNLGIALGMKGANGAAIEQFREALSLKPDFAEAQYYLGAALESQGHLEAAMQHYRQALRLKPGYTKAQASLAGAASRKESNVDRGGAAGKP